jgi:hypothetical protein
VTSRILRAAAVLGLVSIAVSLTPAPATADHGVDSAQGKYTATGTGFGTVQVDFSARSSSIGTDSRGSARWTFPQHDPNTVVTGEVTCLRVLSTSTPSGAVATIGGRLTRVHGDGIPLCPTCQGFLIQVSDAGKFSNVPDTEFFQFTPTAPPQDACPTPTGGGVPVADGEIVIHDTLP